MRIAIFIMVSLPVLIACNPFVKNINQVNDSRLNSIQLPEGFEIEIYADQVENARSMTLGDRGTLFVGSRRAGRVYAIIDEDRDYRADRVITIAGGLNSPNGVAFRDGDLYVAEISRVIKYPDVEENLDDPPSPVVVKDDFPDETHHGWKYIAFGPDGRLYVPVGAPCNNCLSEREIFASITRMDPDGGNFEIFAHGVRNTVGFDWHPETGTLWFTDNGRDWMGDNRPPDELNRAPRPGMDFGYPYCHGSDISDPEFGDRKDCDQFIPPVQDLGPHVAALGMIFYTGDMFPEAYRNRILIAEHGSWNRTVPIGYRVTMVDPEDVQSGSYEVFAGGWLEGSRAWGRPVDILQLPDGSVLVSDDHADVIYRIHYNQP
ncbi:MAG: sorbosone dehydrogenase family protein [Bacteroidales bacterium]